MFILLSMLFNLLLLDASNEEKRKSLGFRVKGYTSVDEGFMKRTSRLLNDAPSVIASLKKMIRTKRTCYYASAEILYCLKCH